jgi:CO dehydrogenase nickel-insertion accessory protein CooC1
LLRELEHSDEFVIADLEAGVGNLNRMAESSVDALLLVVEATPKSIEVASRAIAIAIDRKVGPIRVIANKIRTPAEGQMIRAALGVDVTEVPEDPAVLAADRDGRSVVDAAPRAPAVSILSAFAASL